MVESAPSIGVLVFSLDPWSTLRFARHQLAARMSRRFKVVWLDPAHRWKEIPQALRRSHHRLPGDPIVARAPLWLPRLPGRVGRWTFRARLAGACRLLERAGCTRKILYTFRPIPEVFGSGIRFDLTCYHISDEYYATPDDRQNSWEAEFIRGVDQVFVHSAATLAKKSGLNPNIEWIPNGVDYAAFAAPASQPADLAAIPHPRIGYVGHVKSQLDWDLIEELISRHTDWSFVFVGAIKNVKRIGERIARVRQNANVHLLGHKRFDELPAYTQFLDACILPYRVDHYTRYIYPLKLHEYLAAGRPVVSTPLPAVLPFRDTVAIAATADEWSAALQAALGSEARTSECQAQRRAVARDYDWDTLAERVMDTLVRRLDEGARVSPEARCR